MQESEEERSNRAALSRCMSELSCDTRYSRDMAPSIDTRIQKVGARPQARTAPLTVVALLALFLASCGGKEVVYIQVLPTEVSTTIVPSTASPTTESPRPITTEVSDDEILGLDTSEFLALTALTVREQYNYCYTDCSYAEAPDEWIRRAGGGYIDNEAVLLVVGFLMERSSAELDDFCNEFYATSDSDMRLIAIENDLDPKAWVVAGYAICDS